MQTNRRAWLKQISIAAAGIGIVPLQSFALPPVNMPANYPGNALIRLSSNENPYGPSPMARLAMAESINRSNRYGWDLIVQLMDAIAKKNQVASDNILMGAGSTEILDITVRLAARFKGSFILANPTFGYWADTAERLGLRKIEVNLTSDKKIDLQSMLGALKPDTQLIYICNPNNPTGTFCKREELESFVKAVPKNVWILVDEAYLDYTTQISLAGLVAEFKNLIIAKTFSKIYGLAGARIGYAIAHAETIEKLGRLQLWVGGSLSVVSTAGALASLKDEKFTADTFSLNEKAKTYTIEQLKRLNISCIASNTNFVYFSLANYKKDFFEQLIKNNIQGTRIFEENGKWSRITVGTMQEMQRFIKAVE
jgi:histidinol-phosphate aminotransferase